MCQPEAAIVHEAFVYPRQPVYSSSFIITTEAAICPVSPGVVVLAAFVVQHYPGTTGASPYGMNEKDLSGVCSSHLYL